MHFHNNEHRESDDRKTKNLNTQNMDPRDHCNKILVLAWAMKIFTFSLRTAMAGDFPHWQEGIFFRTYLFLSGELCQRL